MMPVPLLALSWSSFSVMMFQVGFTARLSTPVARSHKAYSEIASVRELKDGQVIVLDRRELTLQVLDLMAGGSRGVGRTGEGPAEYRAPWKLIPLSGDSTALIDLNAGPRLLIITPNAEVRGWIPLPRVKELGYPDWADGMGRLYSAIHRVASKPGGEDSAWVVRWDGRGRVDTAAEFSLSATSGGTSSPGPVLRMPFAAHDEWSVASDGRVALVSSKPFRVILFEASGKQKVGLPLKDELVRVSKDDKREWRERAQQPALALTSSRGGPITVAWLKLPFREPLEWPHYLPPFLLGGVKFAPDGMLWVPRSTRFGSMPVVDVIDQNGMVVARIELPRRARLLGFGRGSVYLARRDQDGLEWLEKYQLPTFGATVRRK